jgi:hypothetical protein
MPARVPRAAMELLDQIVRHYDQLKEEIRAQPLKRIWTVVVDETEEG